MTEAGCVVMAPGEVWVEVAMGVGEAVAVTVAVA